MFTHASLKYCGYLSFDIAPTTDDHEKTTLLTIRNSESNSRYERRPPAPEGIGEGIVLKRWKERLYMPPPS
ncbi:hypothetical protein TNCV_2838251 [Trichonephila clavipes]|nr:hypothetical protein TNCV_2838251 [Trichonephila clavipes]